MAKHLDDAEIFFVLKQGDKSAVITSVEKVKKSTSIFNVDVTDFSEGEAEVCIDYQLQHFCMPGVIHDFKHGQLSFECEDDACMKARMFMQLLNIQFYKRTQSAKFSSVESAAKVWVNEKAEAFAKAFEQ